MITVNYHLICPTCFTGTSAKHFYGVNNGVKERYLALPEFEVIKIVEKWRIEDGHLCPKCNSAGMIVIDLDVDGEPIYNKKTLLHKCETGNFPDYDGMFIFKITRTNSQVESRVSGRDADLKPIGFLRKAIQKSLDTIVERPESNFSINKDQADFFICITGGYDSEKGEIGVKVEKFGSLGFSRDELKNEFLRFGKQYNLLDRLYPSNPMDLNFEFTSSDHLRYENGRHVAGPHGGARRLVKVEPNITGNEGFSVSMYNLDGNHPVWQNNIQMAKKQMRIIKQSPNEVVLDTISKTV